MTITQKKQIRRRTTGAGTENEIVGVINDFNERIINKIFSYAHYWQGNYPYFSGTVYYGSVHPGSIAYQNPQAIESSQFSPREVPSLEIPQVPASVYPDDVITAYILWDNMKTIVKSLNKIRKFSAYWYHRKNAAQSPSASPGDRYLVNSIKGRAIFASTLPNVTGGSDVSNSRTMYWERSGSATGPTFDPTKPNGIAENQTILAEDMNTGIDNCFNVWYNNCYDNNDLVYYMYTCHLNCHSNCHDSRSRR